MSSRITDSNSASSPELLSRFVTADDQAAFAALVRRHGGWMHGTALRMTGCPDMSGEAIQEAFALLARKRPRCSTEAAFTAWLHRTVIFTVRNHMAKERRRTRLLHRFSREGTVSTAVPDGFSEEALLMLDTAIQELPGAERDLILSRYMPPEVALKCLEGACDNHDSNPADKTVPWLATHLGASDGLDRAFVENWGRWKKSNSAAADEWRAAAIASNPRIAPLVEGKEQAVPSR